MQRAAGAADWLDDVAAPAGSPVACLLSTSAAAIALTIAGASTRRPVAPLGPRLTVDELSTCVDATGQPGPRRRARLRRSGHGGGGPHGPEGGASPGDPGVGAPARPGPACRCRGRRPPHVGHERAPEGGPVPAGSPRRSGRGQRLAARPRLRLRVRLVVAAAPHRRPRHAVRRPRRRRHAAHVRRLQHRELGRPRSSGGHARPPRARRRSTSCSSTTPSASGRCARCSTGRRRSIPTR